MGEHHAGIQDPISVELSARLLKLTILSPSIVLWHLSVTSVDTISKHSQ
jgi:hypothetical protein